jgi:hypothetical protein
MDGNDATPTYQRATKPIDIKIELIRTKRPETKEPKTALDTAQYRLAVWILLYWCGRSLTHSWR